jgi:hypothetical protein
MYKKLLCFGFTAIAMVSASARAQSGILLVAHGASPEWNAQVRETLSQVRWNGPTAVAFLMGNEGIQKVTIPRDLEGLPVRYTPVSLTPHPAIAPLDREGSTRAHRETRPGTAIACVLRRASISGSRIS